MSKVYEYVIEQLAATGFCVLSAEAAFQLRGREKWATHQNCWSDFNEPQQKLMAFVTSLPGVKLFEVQFEEGGRWIPLPARSADELDRRIEWITGRSVVALRAFEVGEASRAAAQAESSKDPVPNWPCAERADRLRAAGVKDERFTEASLFPPKRSGL